MKALSHRVLEDMKLAMAELSGGPERMLSLLEPLYARDVKFADPIQKTEGWDEFAAMNRRLFARSRKLRFEVRAAAADEDEIFITWSMLVDLKRAPSVFTVEGVSHLRLNEGGKIAVHRDYFDLLGSLMASVPVVSKIYANVLRRLG